MVKCISCGGILKADDSICELCDAKLQKHELGLSTSSRKSTGKKTKICPHCNELFSPIDLRIVFYPENSAWYMPKKLVFTCPLCFKYIKSKYAIHVSLLNYLNVFLPIISIKYFGLYSLILVVPTSIYLFLVSNKQSKDPQEFEIRS